VILSTLFMTVAWYGHLRLKNAPLLLVIVVSWSIAFFEYLAQVPANRIGYRAPSGYQLKVLQEAITLVVFVLFAGVWLRFTSAPPPARPRAPSHRDARTARRPPR
jgi:uncharacterized protein (DUF486 family)